jgi:hypothetical protein
VTHFCYPDTEAPFTGRPVPYHQQNAVKHWARHYLNWCELRFIERRGDRQEVVQARKELIICQRKMDHWQRHANWSAAEAATARAAADKIWESVR